MKVEITEIEKEVVKKITEKQQKNAIKSLELLILKKRNEEILKQTQQLLDDISNELTNIGTETEETQNQIIEIAEKYKDKATGKFVGFDSDGDLIYE